MTFPIYDASSFMGDPESPPSPCYWKGPYVDGISKSLLETWMACPYCAYIYLILGLHEPIKEPNLFWGNLMHKGLEIYLATRDREAAFAAMDEYVAADPNLYPPSFLFSTKQMLCIYTLPQGTWRTEIVFDKVVDIKGVAIRLRGKVDGYCIDHPDYDQLLCDHKCKGYIDPEQTKREMHEDLQMNMYLRFHPAENILYDLIKVPDTQKYGPVQNSNDSTMDYVRKLYRGPIGSYGGQYPIYHNKHSWLRPIYCHISFEQQELYWQKTIIPLILRLVEWYEYVTQPNFDYNDPKYYNTAFYRMPVRRFDARLTDNYKCSYYDYLVGDSYLSDYTPVTSYFSELDE